ncbi:MAG: PEP-CTERM sorting domain-containing protein [Desulfobacula sp.]|nr:PEP-CTERM sorting domain-containing protein [Desulfobacula sp.]
MRVMVCLVFFLSQSALVLASGSQSPGADYRSYGNYNDQAIGFVGYNGNSSDPDSVRKDPAFAGGAWTALTLGNGYSYSQAYGYADAGDLAMGVTAWAKSTPNNNRFTEAYINTGAHNRFTVSADPSSELENGDTAVLNLKVRVDGTLFAAASQYPYPGWAHSEINADLSIRDYGLPVPADERSYTQLASFGASAEIEAYDVYAPYWGYGFSSGGEEYWATESNMQDMDDDSNEWNTHDWDSNGYSHYMDTGWLTIAFEVIVGNLIDVDASLYTYANAENDGEAWARFGNTFAFDVRPETEGVNIVWETLGSPRVPWDTEPDPNAVVPEPGTLSLLVSGLICLAGFSRRSRQE